MGHCDHAATASCAAWAVLESTSICSVENTRHYNGFLSIIIFTSSLSTLSLTARTALLSVSSAWKSGAGETGLDGTGEFAVDDEADDDDGAASSALV